MEWLTSGETSAAITSYVLRQASHHRPRSATWTAPGAPSRAPSAVLQRRLAEAGSGVRAVAAHPGIATTNLTSPIGSIRGKLGRGFKHLFNDAERGALPRLSAATQDVPGACYAGPDGPGPPPRIPRDRNTVEKGEGRGSRTSAMGALSSPRSGGAPGQQVTPPHDKRARMRQGHPYLRSGGASHCPLLHIQ
jgi:hypothetical protein